MQMMKARLSQISTRVYKVESKRKNICRHDAKLDKLLQL
jgi:hypothetical protein